MTLLNLASLSRDIADRARAPRSGPLTIAVDGPVAAGKTTFARSLAAMLDGLGLKTAVISADGFLRPLAELEAAGLMARKGFPESFNRAAMRAYLAALGDGGALDAPAYAHELYDISPDQRQTSTGADLVIFEGVNVLQEDLAPLYGYRIYLDTPAEEARARFIRRFTATRFTPMRERALAPWRPADGDPNAWAEVVWAAINGPNLDQHIAKGRALADAIVAI